MFQRLIASIREFIDGVRGELKKVSFPSKAETIGATTVVIVFCILMSLYLSMMDSAPASTCLSRESTSSEDSGVG